MNEAYHNAVCHTYEYILSHICMSHVTHMHEECHTFGCVMSHIGMSHVTYMRESCRAYLQEEDGRMNTYEYVTSHV